MERCVENVNIYYEDPQLNLRNNTISLQSIKMTFVEI